MSPVLILTDEKKEALIDKTKSHYFFHSFNNIQSTQRRIKAWKIGQ